MDTSIIYLMNAYKVLVKHKQNLKLIASTINHIDLDWLIQFLSIISLIIIIWINDALFGLPYVTQATNFGYAASIFFLAYFAIKQKTIFAFKEKDINDISDLLETANEIEAKTAVIAASATIKEKSKAKRLSVEQIENLSIQLSSLMENDKLFLDNDLNLPTVAEKLNLSIHETSFLINETSKENFYNFINKYRVDEAKKLLASVKMAELNILGIAFASGFNSKTTFNTTFKRVVGISPSQYSREQKK